MQKKALLALMLVLTMVLTGCTLVQKDPEVDKAQEVLRLGDKVITKGEVQEQVQSYQDYMSYIYSMYGMSYDASSSEAMAQARDEALNAFKNDMMTEAKIAELGMDQLTEEEEAQVQADGEKSFQDSLKFQMEDNEDYKDLTDEEKTAKATEDLAKNGITPESSRESARKQLVEQKLRDYVIKDVTVTDEDIQKDYDEKVASAKSSYENNAGSWASAANNGSSTLYYTPAGVRYVKQILVKFTEEDQAKIDTANGKITAAQAILDNADATEEEKTAAQGNLEAAQAELTAAQDAAFANLDPAADEIAQQLADGADWDTLMAEKTQDPGMQSGITAERGYAVSADMTSFDSAFVEAAMALEKVGDVSPKTKGASYGYYIIKYVGDAAEGPIPLDEVKESLRESLLTTKQNETYDNTLAGWVSEGDFKVNTKVLDN